MNINKNIIRATVLATGLFLSAGASAWHGGGGYHGGYGGYHGYHGGWNGYHGGGWHGGGWYGGAYNVPVYYNSGCGTVRICNRYGSCWLQNRCY